MSVNSPYHDEWIIAPMRRGNRAVARQLSRRCRPSCLMISLVDMHDGREHSIDAHPISRKMLVIAAIRGKLLVAGFA